MVTGYIGNDFIILIRSEEGQNRPEKVARKPNVGLDDIMYETEEASPNKT